MINIMKGTPVRFKGFSPTLFCDLEPYSYWRLLRPALKIVVEASPIRSLPARTAIICILRRFHHILS
nr:MAG TPA: hypothetical protein [Caudoviricetes sp.]